MENASKALIIAGAILLSILIIALGMRIYNSSSSSAANADLSATEIASFNSTFVAYEGEQKGTVVRSLITAVKSSNKKNASDRYIFINREGTQTDFSLEDTNGKKFLKSESDIKSNETYHVDIKYDNTTGFIRNIAIYQLNN